MVRDQPRVPADGVSNLAGGVGDGKVSVRVATDSARQFPVSAYLFRSFKFKHLKGHT